MCLSKSHLSTLPALSESPQLASLSPTARNSPDFKTHPQSALCPLYKSEKHRLPGKSTDRGEGWSLIGHCFSNPYRGNYFCNKQEYKQS